jgi:hypothetical protein
MAAARKASIARMINGEIVTYGFGKELREMVERRVLYKYMKADERWKKSWKKP